MTCVLGIDIGGTSVAAGVVAADGTISHIHTAPTPRTNPGELLDAVTGVALQSLAAGPPVVAVGVGTAGVVDVGRGVILSATETLPGWAGTEVGVGIMQRLQTHTQVCYPIHVVNDVDAHAAGEAYCGGARDAASALVVAVGTGVGAGVVLAGRVWHGAHHVAGEIAHVPVPGAEELWCPCGRFGHLEAIASGVGMGKLYRLRGGDSDDARVVVARAQGGELLARSCVAEAATALGKAIAGVVTVLDPQVVVVGGGVVAAGDQWWQAVQGAFRAEVIKPLAQVPLVKSALGAGAPIVGAAAAWWLHTADAEDGGAGATR